MRQTSHVTAVLALFLMTPASGAFDAPSRTTATTASESSPRRDELPIRLPPDLVFEQSPDSIGQVVFRHTTHVAFASGDCITCHVRLFSILHPTHKTSHEEMVAGRSCGSCHDGTQAFGTVDGSNCPTCHAGAGDPGPASDASTYPSWAAQSTILAPTRLASPSPALWTGMPSLPAFGSLTTAERRHGAVTMTAALVR